MVNKGILFCIVILAGFVPVKINAQSVLDTIRVEAFITPEGDTIPQSWLPTVEVSAKQTNQWRIYYLSLR